jgi:8-oxo-dGTP pyrophosphatase MutT (NUDIX family)
MSRSKVQRGHAVLEISAGGVVIRRTEDGVRYLVIRDSYRNWGFPKGHVEAGEGPEEAALREVQEETGLKDLRILAPLPTIEWYFRFRGKLIHKVCHFYLMETESGHTSPQHSEGITVCRWEPYEQALRLLSYENARDVLRAARALIERPASVA